MTIGDNLTVYMGFDYREAEAYNVAEFSIKRRATRPVAVVPLDSKNLFARGLLTRPVQMRDGKMWDVISDAPQATEFAVSRFLTPILHKNILSNSGWAIFMDCDMLVRTDLNELAALLDPQYAVMCVKHQYEPSTKMKMDGQLQTLYARKNWSSVMAFNTDHPANEALTVKLINAIPGRDLHAFSWLDDSEIGALPREWNALIGEPGYDFATAKIAHYTLGGPWMGVATTADADNAWWAEVAALKRSQLAVS